MLAEAADSTRTKPKVSRKRRWRRRRRRTLIALLVLTIAAAAVYHHFTQPAKVARLAADTLARVLGADVAIHDASFSITGHVMLSGLTMRVPGIEGKAGDIADIERVDIEFSPWALLKGEFRATDVSLHKPRLLVCEDVDARRFNFEQLQLQHMPETQAPRTTDLPQVFVNDGQAIFGESRGGAYAPLGNIRFNGNLTGYNEDPGTYFFLLRQMREEQGPAPVISGEFDLKRLKVSGKVDDFAFDKPQRNLLPSDVRKWWDALKPSGSLPTVNFTYDAPAGFSAELIVHDLAMTIPFADQRSRLQHVSGRFLLSRALKSNDVTIRWENITGQLKDPAGTARYVINGTAQGSTLDAPFDLDVRVTGNMADAPSVLTAKPEFLLQELIQHQFWQYAPNGKFKIAVRLVRDADAGPIHYNGKVDLSDATILYTYFPYELKDARAEFVFDETGIDIKRIDAVGPSGAKIHITGRIIEPGNESGLVMDLEVRDAPVDKVLFDAVTPLQRKVLALFFDEPGYRKLLREGWYTDDPAKANQRDVSGEGKPLPYFKLGGKANLDIHVNRPKGSDRTMHMQVVATSAGPLHMMFRYWNYPCVVEGGRLVITNEEVRAENIQFTGLHGGSATIDGRYYRHDDGHWGPDLTVKATGLPMDELLLATISPPQDEWLRRLNLAGELGAEAHIILDEEKRHTYRITTTMKDGRAQPHGGHYTLDVKDAQVDLQPGRADIRYVKAQHGESLFDATGLAKWSGGPAAVSLAITGKDVACEEGLIDLIPEEMSSRKILADVFAKHKPAGIFDFKLGLTQGENANYVFDVSPRTLAFTLNEQRIELTDMSGRVEVTPGLLTFKDLSATWPAGRGTVNGTVRTDDKALRIDVMMDGAVTSIDPTVRAVLPPGVVSMVDRLKLGGAFSLTGAKLKYAPDDDGVAHLAFNGDIVLKSATAEVGLPVTELTGLASIKADYRADQPLPRVDLSLKADELRVLDRRIAPATLKLSNRAQSNRFVIEELGGSVYGGTLVGDGELWVEDDPSFRVDLVLQDASLAPFIKPRAAGADDDPASVSEGATGSVTASLSIEGKVSDIKSRSGRGELRVRDANLYRTPLAVALLQVINLTWPSAKQFDRAGASYLIDGDTIRFDNVQMSAPTVEVTGKGTMVYSTQTLDLRLVSRNPNTDLGALGDLVNLFKDQIISIEVSGTLSDPKARVESFDGFKKTMREIFGEAKAPPRKPTTVGVP